MTAYEANRRLTVLLGLGDITQEAHDSAVGVLRQTSPPNVIRDRYHGVRLWWFLPDDRDHPALVVYVSPLGGVDWLATGQSHDPGSTLETVVQSICPRVDRAPGRPGRKSHLFAAR